MFEKIRIIFTIPELRQKILLTLGLLAIYRVGWQVPLPIVDPAAMRAFAEESGGISDLLKTVAVFSASQLSQGNHFWSWHHAIHFGFNYFSVIRHSVAPARETPERGGRQGERKLTNTQGMQLSVSAFCKVGRMLLSCRILVSVKHLLYSQVFL